MAPLLTEDATRTTPSPGNPRQRAGADACPAVPVIRVCRFWWRARLSVWRRPLKRAEGRARHVPHLGRDDRRAPRLRGGICSLGICSLSNLPAQPIHPHQPLTNLTAPIPQPPQPPPLSNFPPNSSTRALADTPSRHATPRHTTLVADRWVRLKRRHFLSGCLAVSSRM